MIHTTLSPHDRKDAGFTLVELAIVMIIIGLLVGGVLKGQELIANARITSTVSQVKGIEAATTTFRDMYDALPGDLTNPGVRLPQCTAAPCNAPVTATDGNGRIDGAPGAALSATTVEGIVFWSQLAAADLITGVNTSGGNTDIVWGRLLPSTDIGGGFTVGFSGDGSTGLTGLEGPAGRGGHYLALRADPATAVGNANSTVLTASQAARIDRKMDDGLPNAGTVRSANDGAGTCATATTSSDPYNEAADEVTCSLYIRFQQ